MAIATMMRRATRQKQNRRIGGWARRREEQSETRTEITQIDTVQMAEAGDTAETEQTVRQQDERHQPEAHRTTSKINEI